MEGHVLQKNLSHGRTFLVGEHVLWENMSYGGHVLWEDMSYGRMCLTGGHVLLGHVLTEDM